ncbi:hypothetical protein CRUP_026421, partial [Coryphaenoides rupestris]
ERVQLKELLGRARAEQERARAEALQARREAEVARGERDQAREESRRAREDRERLERQVEVLKDRCARLGRRVRQEKKKAEERVEKAQEAAPSSGERNGSLHMDDLVEPPLSPAADSQSSLDDMRRYISTEEASLHQARQLLEREGRRLTERQAVLRGASNAGPFTRNHHGLDPTGHEASRLERLQQTVQRGSALLRRKEEHLHQLESSMAQEVTFDVTDSDLSSTLDPQDSPGAGPTVPAKVQQLAESLQQISGQLNMVLGALGSLAPPSSVSASAGTQGPAAPLSTGPSWAWGGGTHSRASPGATPLFAAPVAGAPRAPGDLLSSRWAQLYPDPVTSSTLRTGSAYYSSFTPASESAHSLLHATPPTLGLDGQRLQGLIDGNKRWLELRRKDAS